VLRYCALTRVFRFIEIRSEFDRVSNIERDERAQLTLAQSQHAGYFDIRIRVNQEQSHVATEVGAVKS